MDALIRGLIRYLLDCICSALIPPCPTCDDTAVKLACLEVKDCNVDYICNLERTFLLTEHNLRYWLPFLHSFGEALERLCCEFSKIFDKPILGVRKDKGKQRGKIATQPEFFTTGKPVYKTVAAQPAYPNILRITGLSDDTLRPTMNISNSLVNVLSNQPQVTDVFAKPKEFDFVADSGSNAIARVLDHPKAKAAFEIAAEKQLRKVESRIEALSVEGLKVVEEIQDRIGTRVRELEDDLSKRPTTTKLGSTKVIKDLQSELNVQKKANTALADRIKKLEKESKK